LGAFALHDPDHEAGEVLAAADMIDDSWHRRSMQHAAQVRLPRGQNSASRAAPPRPGRSCRGLAALKPDMCYKYRCFAAESDMNEQSPSPGAGRGAAREARRAARGQRRQGKLPYITRRLPVVELLSTEA